MIQVRAGARARALAVSYGSAVLAVLVAVIVRLLLDPLLDARAPLLVLVFAVVTAAWLGGFGPGMLATALSVAAGLWIFIPPIYSFSIPSTAEGVRLVLFTMLGTLVSVIAETARRNARRRLRESEERFRLLVDGVRDYAIFMLDRQGRVTSWNTGAERLKGYKVTEVIGRHVSCCYPPDKVASGHVQRLLEAATREGRIEEEGWPVRKDGSLFLAAMLITALRNSKCELRGFAKVTRDITRHRRRDEALRLSEERYRSLVTATASIVWVASADGAMNDAMPSWESFTGQKPAQYRGLGWLEAIHPEDRNAMTQTWNRVLEGSKMGEAYFRLRRKDGRYLFMQARVVPVFDAHAQVREWVSTCTDISEHKESEARLMQLANYDQLTKLPNRNLFIDRLGQALARALRNKQTIAVLFLDLDGFKHVNDTLGHDIGDLLLKTVAERLLTCCRSSDTVARFGGDEFVLMLEGMARTADINRIARGVVGVLSKPFQVAGNELFITTSMGISVYPRDGDDPITLLKSADTAMYQAKKQGNRYEHYSRALGLKASKRLALESQLRRALARDELLLHYQPQIDLASGRIETVEALLRWRRPGAEALIAPVEFISLAEECGLIVPIGEWVLKTACAQLQTWRAQGAAPARLAVNVSARQFYEKNLKKTIDRCLSDTGTDHSSLELELTESILQSDRAERLLPTLKKAGIKIAIDDFGTGFSSLSYLKRFPVHKLKIDRSFTREIPTHADNAAISTAVIAMAHSLNLEVTAEGVETAEQLAFLRELRCDGAQGYLLSEPVPGEEITRLLSSMRQGSGGPFAPPIAGTAYRKH